MKSGKKSLYATSLMGVFLLTACTGEDIVQDNVNNTMEYQVSLDLTQLEEEKSNDATDFNSGVNIFRVGDGDSKLTLTNITNKTITYKVYGNYVEGQDYFNSIASAHDTSTFGSTRRTASKDDKGTYLEGTLGVNTELTKGTEYLITISNTSTNPTDLYDKHFIVLE